MNLKNINEILKQNNLTINDISNLAKRFEHLNLKNDEDLKLAIKQIANFLGKEVSQENQNKMIETLKKGNFKL